MPKQIHNDLGKLADRLPHYCLEPNCNGGRLMRELEALTPGGSEYVGDVEACLAAIKQSREFERKLRERLRENLRNEMVKITLTSDDIDTLVAGGTVTTSGVELKLLVEVHQATGAEIREFYQNGWDSDYYYESEDASVQIEDENGNWIAEDNRVYNLRDLGTLGWQGSSLDLRGGKPKGLTFEEAFLAWKNKA